MIKTPKLKLRNDGKRVCLARTEYGQYAKGTDEIIFKALNENFEVALNGESCEVRECRVSAVPFNRPWPGKQRQFEQTESAGFISFAADETVTLSVKSKKAFEKALVRPKSKKIKTEIKDEAVVFTLKEPGSYVLELDDSHNVLHIFFNPIKEYKEAEQATHYFGPGMHFPGIISLRDNDRVYIDPEAVVFGSIHSRGAKNVKIFGGGVIDNSCEERITENAYEDHTKGCFRIYNCENIEVSDIILTNSSTWVLSMFNCSNIKIDNVKIVGQWRYNADGIDVVNSDHVTITNSFIRAFDDVISIKAIYDHNKPVENIVVDNCVLWCDWGKTCEVGVETAGKEYKNIVFKNCDILHNMLAALCVSNGYYAEIHDVLFENINVELQEEMVFDFQREENQVYEWSHKKRVPYLVLVRNDPYELRVIESEDGSIRKAADELGDVHDVVYKNINVITENEGIKPCIIITSKNPEKNFNNFTFENLCLNGVKVDNFDSFDTIFSNVDNIIITGC